MAQETQQVAAHPYVVEPEKLVPQQRLRRALGDPEVLEDFLADPREVAHRYGVSLTDEEITAIRNGSRFFASWDYLCGDGQWLDSARFDGRAPPGSLSVPEVALNRIRERIAEEILQEMPRAIQRTVAEIGGEALIDPQESLEDLPEHVQPLARTLRQLTRTMIREVVRQLPHPHAYRAAYSVVGPSALEAAFRTPAAGAPISYPGLQQGVAASPEGMAPTWMGWTDGIAAPFTQALGHYLQEAVNHAAQEAVEHVRPRMTRRPPHRRRREAEAERVEPTA